MMIVSLKDVMSKAVRVYVKEPRAKWVLEWPGQVVIAASTVHWTTDVTEAIERGKLKVFIRTHRECGHTMIRWSMFFGLECVWSHMKMWHAHITHQHCSHDYSSLILARHDRTPLPSPLHHLLCRCGLLLGQNLNVI